MEAIAQDHSTSTGLVSLFAGLHVEEPSDEFLKDTPSSAKPTSLQVNQDEYTVKIETDLEEVYFALHCLFNDMDNVRRYLQEVWKGYKQGLFELIPASITTNTAIEFVRHLQEDFVDSFPQHTDFEKHINVFYLQICLAGGHDPTFKQNYQDEMNFAVYDAADKIMFPTFMLLSSFSDVVVPGQLPMYKPGHFGVYDAASDRSVKSSRNKFREDKVVLLEILPEFCVLAQLHDAPPAEDEMTRGIREMIKTREIPIWLTFAAQIFLDTHHIMRDQVGKGYHDLVKSARYVENNIKQALKFHENLRIENWPESNDQVLKQILRRIEGWVKTDVVAESRKLLLGRTRFQPPPSQPFLLLQQHPLYCGLLSFSIKLLSLEAGITFANAWGSIIYTAHLYNAIRQEKLLTSTWQDMNFALFVHRIEDIFIGGFPATIDDYFKRFSLAMGYSATNFAKNKRQTNVTASKAGPRGLNDLCPVSSMFKARYCYDENRANLTPADVDTILELQPIEESNEDESSDWIRPGIKINVPKEPNTPNENHAKSPAATMKKKQSAFSGIRPLQLLNALLDTVQSETLELTFDHFRLHTFSWRLLRAVQKAIDEDLRDIYGAGYLEKENQLPFVVGYIFMTAVQTTKLAGVLMPKKKDIVTSKLLVKAAEAVKTMLETGGGEIEMLMLQKWFGFEIEVEDVFAPIEPSK